MLTEDSYGRVKRQSFVESVIREINPRHVLDFGCGTGTQLAMPLAAANPQVAFYGVDSDQATIDWAQRQPAIPNLTFSTSEDVVPEGGFDLIIASEVLEHVEAPDDLLKYLRSRLADNGRLIVTTPNGYGPFEAAALTENLFTVAGVLPLIRRIKRKLKGAPQMADTDTMTLAVSPHVNFFSLNDMRILFQDAGFEVVRFRSRTVFCGFLFDRVIRGSLFEWNGRLADRLPAWCASDWMYACVKTPVAPTAKSRWRRNAWGRFRRRLSERRWAGISMAYH